MSTKMVDNNNPFLSAISELDTSTFKLAAPGSEFQTTGEWLSNSWMDTDWPSLTSPPTSEANSCGESIFSIEGMSEPGLSCGSTNQSPNSETEFFVPPQLTFEDLQLDSHEPEGALSFSLGEGSNLQLTDLHENDQDLLQYLANDNPKFDETEPIHSLHATDNPDSAEDVPMTAVNKEQIDISNVSSEYSDMLDRNQYAQKSDLTLREKLHRTVKNRKARVTSVSSNCSEEKLMPGSHVATRKGQPSKIIEQCNMKLGNSNTNRNALNAKINRERKKVYMQELEHEVHQLRSENKGLKSSRTLLTTQNNDLQKEVEYLKSVLQNESALAGVLGNIGAKPGLRLSSSFCKRSASSESDHDYDSSKKGRRSGVCLHVRSEDDISIELCSHCATEAEGSR